jgi:uncharacterized membrane protein
MIQLIVAVIAFVGTHILLSGTSLRARVVGAIGERPFAGLFSVIAAVTLVWSVVAYNGAPQTGLWNAGGVLHGLNLVLVALGFVLVVAGVTTRNPAAMGQESAAAADNPAVGILAVTRHPLSWGIVLWAAGHILANGDLASVFFFGSFIAVGIAGSLSQERKKHSQLGANWDRFVAATSFVPFAAIAQGRARTDFAAIGWWRFGVAAVLFVAMLFLHGAVIGVPALPS